MILCRANRRKRTGINTNTTLTLVFTKDCKQGIIMLAMENSLGTADARENPKGNLKQRYTIVQPNKLRVVNGHGNCFIFFLLQFRFFKFELDLLKRTNTEINRKFVRFRRRKITFSYHFSSCKPREYTFTFTVKFSTIFDLFAVKEPVFLCANNDFVLFA